MITRSREDALRELGELFDYFREALVTGNRHFWTAYAADAHRVMRGARAFLIRDFIVDELKKLLDGRPGIAITEGNQTTLFCCGQNWVLQVHKLDEGCCSAPNATQMSLESV
jgi:hypothetical protein